MIKKGESGDGDCNQSGCIKEYGKGAGEKGKAYVRLYFCNRHYRRRHNVVYIFLLLHFSMAGGSVV